MAHHIVRRGEGYPDRRIMHPARDWLIGLTGAAFLFLCASAGAGYLFWSKSNAATTASEVTIDSVKYDPKLIERVLTNYRARQAQYESLQENIISVPAVLPQATSTEQAKPVSTRPEPPVAKGVQVKVE